MLTALRNRLVKLRHKEYDNIDEGDDGGSQGTIAQENGAQENGGNSHPQGDDIQMHTLTPGGKETENGHKHLTDTLTVEQAVEAIGFGKFQIKLYFLLGLAWICDAMELMLLSVLGPALRCEWKLWRWEEALITTVVFIGMVTSSWLWGTISDKYGRKTGLILSSLYVFYYGLLSTFSPGLIWIFILRWLVGFGIGGVPQALTLYSEFLPASSRAKGLMLFELFWAAGACLEVTLALIVMPTLGWRWLLALSSIPALIFAVVCVWLPESARYELTRGRQDKAIAILERIAEENNKPMPHGKLKQSGTIDLEQEEVKRGRFLDLFNPEIRITTPLLWVLWFVSAFCYYGVALLTTELFDKQDVCNRSVKQAIQDSDCNLDCNLLKTKDYLDILWTTAAEFPGILLALIVVDLLGRKKALGINFILFSVFLLLICICPSRTVLVVFVFVARAFSIGSFQICYVYTAEVYPTSTRALGMGICSGIGRVGSMITPFIAQVLLQSSIYLTVSIYGVSSLMAAIVSFLLPIETKGREMKDFH